MGNRFDRDISHKQKGAPKNDTEMYLALKNMGFPDTLSLLAAKKHPGILSYNIHHSLH